jgi:hypothetical protein
MPRPPRFPAHASLTWKKATALALLLIVIGGDRPGHEIEHPMAVVILGGLFTSTFLNLFVMLALSLRNAKASEAGLISVSSQRERMARGRLHPKTGVAVDGGRSLIEARRVSLISLAIRCPDAEIGTIRSASPSRWGHRCPPSVAEVCKPRRHASETGGSRAACSDVPARLQFLQQPGGKDKRIFAFLAY